jgi:hypothetical protein
LAENEDDEEDCAVTLVNTLMVYLLVSAATTIGSVWGGGRVVCTSKLDTRYEYAEKREFCFRSKLRAIGGSVYSDWRTDGLSDLWISFPTE